MNLAAMFASPMSDYIRINYKTGLVFNQFGTELTLSSYRVIYAVSCILTLINILFIGLINEDREYL